LTLLVSAREYAGTTRSAFDVLGGDGTVGEGSLGAGGEEVAPVSSWVFRVGRGGVALRLEFTDGRSLRPPFDRDSDPLAVLGTVYPSKSPESLAS
jgi:hypothetical protein